MYSIERERTSLRSLPSLLWLMFRQKDARLYNGCWQSSCLTGFCFDSAQCFQRTAVPLFIPFLWWGRSFLQCPSPCLFFPSDFLWFLRQGVFGLQLLDTSMAQSERPVVYCTCETLRNRQVQLGRSIKYIYPERFKGSSGQDKTDQTFPHWKIHDCLPQEKLLLPILWPRVKKKKLSQQAFYLHFNRETLCQSSFTLLSHYKAEADTCCSIHTQGNRTKDNNQIITTYFTVNISPLKQTQQWADPNKMCCLCSHSLM